MYRFGGQSNQDTESRMRSILAKCFSKAFQKYVPMHIFVDILLFMSEIRLDFVFKEAIFPLLGVTEKKSKLAQQCPFKMAIAIEATRVIADMRASGQKPDYYTGPHLGRHYEQFFIHEPLRSEETVSLGFGTFFDEVRNFLGSVLMHVNQTVFANEFLILRYEQRGDYVNLYAVLLSHIPRLFPTGVPEREVVHALCSAAVHPDYRLKQKAYEALSRIITVLPNLAHHVIQSFANIVLLNLYDEVGLLDDALETLRNLIGVWLTSIRQSNPPRFESSAPSSKLPNLVNVQDCNPSIPSNAACVEALFDIEVLSLVALCSPHPSTRALVLDLLGEARLLSDACRCEGYSLVIDLIESDWPSVLQNCTESHLKQVPSMPATTNDFYELVRTDINHWHIHLGALLRHLAALESKNTLLKQCWRIVKRRFISTILTIDEAKRLSDVPGADTLTLITGDSRWFSKIMKGFSKEESLSRQVMSKWINYLTFLCASASTDGEEIGVLRSRTQKDKDFIETTKDLFQFVVPFLRHGDEEVGDAIVHSLASVNPSVCLSLLEDLQPYHALCSTLKSEKKRLKLRIRIIRVLELSTVCFRQRSLLETSYFEAFFSEYVHETYSFLSQEPITAQTGRVLSHFGEYLYFMMKHIAKANLEDHYLPAAKRKSLYSLFLKYSGLGGSIATSGTTFNYKAQPPSEPQNLNYSAICGMVGTLYGELFAQSNTLRLEYTVFADVTLMLSFLSSLPLGREAVSCLLVYNQSSAHAFESVLHLCYSLKLLPPKGYFLSLADVLSSGQLVVKQEWLAKILCLVLYEIGNPDQETRKTAITLMNDLGRRYLGGQGSALHLSLTSVLSATYTLSQKELSASLADNHPEQALSMIEEMARCIRMVPHGGQRRLLHCLTPWVKKIVFFDDQQKLINEDVLCHLFCLTVQQEESHPEALEVLWKAVASRKDNMKLAIDFLLYLGTEVADTATVVVPHAQKIAVYLGRYDGNSAFSELVHALDLSIEHTTWVTFERSRPLLQNYLDYHYESEFVEMSRAVFAMCTCVELTTEVPVELLDRHLPVILHALFVNIDSDSILVFRLSKTLLSNVIHSFFGPARLHRPKTHETSLQLINRLLKTEKRMWKSFDYMSDNYSADVRALQDLVREVKGILESVAEGFALKWELKAHETAMLCVNSHVAIRSLQICQALDLKFRDQVFVDIISRLATSVADEVHIVHCYTIELLKYLKARVMSLSNEVTGDPSKILWTALTILDLDEEQEWKLGVELVACCLKKFPLSIFRNLSREICWGDFPGLLALLTSGLTSSVNLSSTVDTLLTVVPLLAEFNNILDPQRNGFLYCSLALLPQLLYCFPTPSELSLAIASSLAKVFPLCVYFHSTVLVSPCKQAAALLSFVNLSKLFGLYNSRDSAVVKSEEQWLKDVCRYLAEAYFPQFETFALHLILVLLESSYNKYHESLYSILNGLLCAIRNDPSSLSLSETDNANLVQVLLRTLDSCAWKQALLTINATMHKFKVTRPLAPFDAAKSSETSTISSKSNKQLLIRERLARLSRLFTGLPQKSNKIVVFRENSFGSRVCSQPKSKEWSNDKDRLSDIIRRENAECSVNLLSNRVEKTGWEVSRPPTAALQQEHANSLNTYVSKHELDLFFNDFDTFLQAMSNNLQTLI